MLIPLTEPVAVPAKVYTHWRITTARYGWDDNHKGWALNINLNRFTDAGEMEQARPMNLNIFDMEAAVNLDPSFPEVKEVIDLVEAATKVAATLLKIKLAEQAS